METTLIIFLIGIYIGFSYTYFAKDGLHSSKDWLFFIISPINILLIFILIPIAKIYKKLSKNIKFHFLYKKCVPIILNYLN